MDVTDMGVFDFAARLVLLLAVLIQYTPIRVCALERATLGSNCHEWSASGGVGDGHDGAQSCGFGGSTEQECICEQPKGVGEHWPLVAVATLHWAALAMVDRVFDAPVIVPFAPAALDPDPPGDLLASLQLPLLI